MTLYYFMQFPSEWRIAPRITRKRSDIEQIINEQIEKMPIEIETGKLDRARDNLVEELWLKELETRKDGFGQDLMEIKYTNREDLAIKNQETIERAIRQKFLDDKKKALFNLFCTRIEAFDLESLDQKGLSRLEILARQYGVPEIELADELRKRRADLEWERQFKIFYKSASVTNSIIRGGRGTAKLMHKYPRMIRLRYYTGPNGCTRKTVEIEVD